MAFVGTATAQEKGTFTDKRDGKTYKTVKIGKQTWMAENLNYQTKSGAWCYENIADSCQKYGRIYDWKTAKTVCPTGFHLPASREWDALSKAVGGERKEIEDESGESSFWGWDGAGGKLKARSGWNEDGINGTDDYGFSALPGGHRESSGVSFRDIGYSGVWWTATETSGGFASTRRMDYSIFSDIVSEGYGSDKRFGFSVRCVQD